MLSRRFVDSCPAHNNAMHEKPDLRVVLEWTITRSGSVIAAVMPSQAHE